MGALVERALPNPVADKIPEKANAAKLRTIARKRFNPTVEAWQLVPHTVRGNWRFNTFYCNTHKAHELGKRREWVVSRSRSRNAPL